MEVKLDTGIDRSVRYKHPESVETVVFEELILLFRRTINCMVGQMKHILATEQKKTDFRPEDENNVMIQYTTVSDPTTPAAWSARGFP